MFFKKLKTKITITNRQAQLPSDFYELWRDHDEPNEWVFYKMGTDFLPIQSIEMPFNIRFEPTDWRYYLNFTFDAMAGEYYIDYITDSGFTPLVNNADTIKLPKGFNNSVYDFSLVEYFRRQQDWQSVSNAMQYAEWKFAERIGQLWDNR